MVSEQKLDTLEESLRHKLETMTGFADEETMARRLEDTFRYFDTNNSGSIEFPEFTAAMSRLNFIGVQRELEGLFYRYDEDLSGSLDYTEFSKNIFNMGSNVNLTAQSRSVIERVKGKIIERGGANGIRGVTLILRRWDDNGSRNLDRTELREGLLQYGVQLDDEPGGDLDKLMQFFDRDGSGTISIEEFHRGLRGSMSHRRKLLVKQAFDLLDNTDTGVVTLEDMRNAFDTSTHPDVVAGRCTADEALADMMDVFDGAAGNNDGKITWAEFLDYYKDISAGIDEDDYFELMIRNAWHISGGEGWSANTSCRRVLVIHSDDTEEVVEIKNDLGLAADDIDSMIQRLISQGVHDIKRISLAD